MKHERLADATDHKELAKAAELESKGKAIRRRVLTRLRQRAKREREKVLQTTAERR